MQEANNATEPSKDINDIFSDILLTEENLIEASYQKGVELSKTEDNIEGYHLGYHRGSELGTEIGYYTAISQHYFQHFRANSQSNERILNELTNFQELLSDFPTSNDPDIDILSLLETIRAKFKRISSKLKLKPVSFAKSTLTF